MNEQELFLAHVDGAAATTRRLTQRELVLIELQKNAGEWVPMPQLVRASGAYAVHSRVSDLRSPRHGSHQIEHRNTWNDGVCCSEYRLVIHESATATIHSD